MTRIYVDSEAAAIEGGGDRSAGGETSPDAEAVRALRYLVEAGHDVIVVAPAGQELPDDLLEVARETVSDVPESYDVPAWYLTREVERCVGLSARVRTVLIGATPPSGSIHRCDTVARDVQAAVMEILAAEAMP